MSRKATPLLAVAGTGTGEGCAVVGDALPPFGVDAPPEKGSFTSPGKGSVGAIRVARLLLTMSSDVTVTDDEVVRASSIGSSSFAILSVSQRFNVSSATGPLEEMDCSAHRVNRQGRGFHPSVAAVETGSNGRVPFSSSTPAWRA